MKGKQEELKLEKGSKEVRRLLDSAAQTRFTWAVIFVALVTVLIGLLTMIQPYTSKINPSFNCAISIVYFFSTMGIPYIFYATCQTSFIIDKLTSEYEKESIKEFVKQYWKAHYKFLFRKKENGKIVFTEKTVISLSILLGVISLLPLLFKLEFGVVAFAFTVFLNVLIEIAILVLALAYNHDNDHNHQEQNQEPEYMCRTAKTIEEDQQLINAGFQYVTERDGIKLYRKRK
jgi:cobalamin biosynthesis protein CobD/CbiB